MNVVVTIALIWLMLVALALAFAIAAQGAGRKLARRRGESAALAVLALAATLCAQKAVPPRWTFDSYVQDAGCWASNSTVHVSLAQRVPGIDLSGSPVLLYAREIGVDDPEAWTELLPRRTFAELPADYALANATNHDFTVFVDYVPPPTVHTNGVWQMRGIELGRDADAARYAFPNTAVADKREIVPIEYLESTGKQWINTGVRVADPSKIDISIDMEGISHFGIVHNNAAKGTWVGLSKASAAGRGTVFWGNYSNANSFNVPEARNVYRWDGGNGFSINGSILTAFTAAIGTDAIDSIDWPLLARYDFYPNGYVVSSVACKLYAAQIRVSSTVVRDFVPVRVGRVGYMYDRVSGEYLPYGNKGTGSFVLGPDKN